MSPTLCNKILQELNLNGLCQYCNSHKVYIFKKSNCIVNCSYVLVFLRQSTCYVITPNKHQWYKISANKILESHKLALWKDHLTHIGPKPPAKLPEINAFTTITGLTFLQTQDEQVSNTYTQPMYSDIVLVNQNTNSSLQNQYVHPHDQSTVILQQFSMITQELHNLTDEVSCDINEIT